MVVVVLPVLVLVLVVVLVVVAFGLRARGRNPGLFRRESSESESEPSTPRRDLCFAAAGGGFFAALHVLAVAVVAVVALGFLATKDVLVLLLLLALDNDTLWGGNTSRILKADELSLSESSRDMGCCWLPV